jgi:TatD DNase family protein
MIDSHCHLDYEPLYSQIESVIDRSKKNGLTRLLTISTTLKSFEKIIEIVKHDPMIFGTFGIHPHETAKDIVTKKMIIKNIKQNNKIIGVGETGLDFFYNHSDKKKQIDSFSLHVESAIELNVPIIVHSRNAENETFEILNSFKKQKPKILMHCFTGSLNFAKKLLTLNAFFSASGIITFKNSTELQNTFKRIDLSKLLVETDSPYLAPIPLRGKKNEPSFLVHTVNKLAEIKKTPVKDIILHTSKNFKDLFQNI